jgi:hypothetical protein
MKRSALWAALALSLALGACAKSADEAAPAPEAAAERARADGTAAGAVAGQANRPGSFLAYEHDVTVRMPAPRIAPRVSAVRAACMEETFGECVVLGENQAAGESPFGELRVRAAPAAIGRLVDIAAEGGEIAQRSTTAEDLADAVRDNGLRRRRLELQHQRLLAYAERPGAGLDELMSVNERLATLEAELQQAEQEAAQQQRRMATNLLTLRFNTDGVTVQDSRTRQALRGLGGIWDGSLAVMVTVAGALLPFALLALVVYAMVRMLRRKKA